MASPVLPAWIEGRPVTTGGGLLDVLSPRDGSVAARVALGTAADIDAALAAATRAFEETSRASSSERSTWLTAMADGLERRRDELAAEICAQAGKPIAMARLEAERAVITFRTAAEEAKRIGGEVLPLDLTAATRGRHGMTRRFPRGVVAGIVPFNFPLNLAAHKVAPALAAGCAIVLKPPPQAPGPTLRLAEIAAEAGVPNGAVNALLAPVSAAQALTTDPRVALLSFTGSARVGWELKARAARKPVLLELGGNGALVVDDTADIEAAAARAALSAFAFAGQVCIKTQRILVASSAYDVFRGKFLAAVERLVVVGDPADPATVCGPVIDDAAAHRIETWAQEALAGGARAVKPLVRNGRMLTPCILEKVPAAAKVSCEEVFGPVVTLEPFDDFDAALDRVNEGPYGLQAGVFTARLDRALRAFEGLDVGAVVLNDSPTFRVDAMPYGGVKESGFGREGLRWAIEEMTELRLLVLPPV
jgi:acyl-CoA reductase-like NAD-dependent aldehyde dehydrogenase